MATLTVSQVSKVYAGDTSEDQAVVALHDVSFTVNDHEFCSILGHSGCGKTTLLTIIAGFEKASAGQLLMDGAPICNPSWERCVIFQDYALFPWMTAYLCP
jgi:NitT/TauT family transport system ATP-binding protein